MLTLNRSLVRNAVRSFSGLALLALSTCANAQYSFTKIIDVSADDESLSLPNINAGGTVVFGRANFATNSIVTSTGGVLTTVIEDSGDLFNFSAPRINDAGTVAFQALRADEDFNVFSGVYTVSGGNRTTIYEVDAFDDFTPFAAPVLNNSGTVAFTLTPNLETYTSILSGNGNSPAAIVAEENDDFGLFSNPTINDAGTVAFSAFVASGGTAVYTGNASGITERIGPDDDLIVVDRPTINNNNDLAIIALFNNGTQEDPIIEEGVFTLSGTTRTTLVDSTGGFNSFFNVAYNNNGQIVFQAELDGDDQVDGIFTGSDPIADKVIAEGDVLDGFIVTDVDFSHKGLNDNGVLTFLVELTDPNDSTIVRYGIYTASVVPGPGAVIVGLMGAVPGILLLRRRARK